MKVVEIMEMLLERQLSEEEVQMLNLISSQGLAKLNADILKGVAAEQTMAQLKMVFVAMSQRRDRIWTSMSSTAKSFVDKLQQNPSMQDRTLKTDELIFIADCCRGGNCPEPVNEDGSLMEAHDIEESAMTFLMDQLQSDFHSLRALPGSAGRIYLSSLVPTTCPKTMTAMGTTISLSATLMRPHLTRKRTNVVGLSPIVSWFDECTESPIEFSASELVALTAAERKAFTVVTPSDIIDPVEVTLSQLKESHPKKKVSFGFPFLDVGGFRKTSTTDILEETSSQSSFGFSPLSSRSPSTVSDGDANSVDEENRAASPQLTRRSSSKLLHQLSFKISSFRFSGKSTSSN